MRRSLCALVCVGLGISGVGCSEATYCPTEQVVEMFSWWVQTGEADARRKLVKMHEERMKREQQPTWVNATTMDNNSLARGFLSSSWRDKQRLPDTFQVNIGQGLLSWKDKGALEPVDFVLDGSDVRSSFFQGVLEEAKASRDGLLYGIPLNIHLTNTLFYNADALKGLVEPGKGIVTLEQFETLCDTLKSGDGRSPIALGTKGAAWTVGLLAHEALYPAMNGVVSYRTLWRGSALKKDEEYFTPLWDVYQKLLDWKNRGWINADFAETTWTDAANRLFATDDTRAVFFVMGDWVQAELRSDAGNIMRAPFPPGEGIDPVFVYTADSFPLSKSANDRRSIVELLRTMTQKDVQLAFSRAKGSIPARADLSALEVEPFRGVYDEFGKALDKHQAVLDVAGCLREGEMPSNDERVEEMLVKGDIELIKQFWRDNYGGLDPNKRTCFQYDE
jgi:glucose/mannose transport system substrate-binding protein